MTEEEENILYEEITNADMGFRFLARKVAYLLFAMSLASLS